MNNTNDLFTNNQKRIKNKKNLPDCAHLGQLEHRLIIFLHRLLEKISKNGIAENSQLRLRWDFAYGGSERIERKRVDT